eukprot:GHVN01039660.1.p1 GENE.GHVN01039660.1~~GHVN01039660.1.p1  ORF type:complete len:115 (+),score=1.07 GHVN01039660.1:79-423(+)
MKVLTCCCCCGIREPVAWSAVVDSLMTMRAFEPLCPTLKLRGSPMSSVSVQPDLTKLQQSHHHELLRQRTLYKLVKAEYQKLSIMIVEPRLCVLNTYHSLKHISFNYPRKENFM